MKQIAKDERQKVAAFWRSFFPEIENDEDYNRIVNTILDMSVDEALTCREKETLKGKNKQYFTENNNISADMKKMDDRLQKNMQWLYFFEPIMARYYDEYIKLIESVNFIEDKEQFKHGLFKNIYSKLLNMGYRTLVQETGIAEEENRLMGDTSQEKNNYYCKELLRNPEYLNEIYDVYPELVRLMDLKVGDIYKYVSEIFENIEYVIRENDDFKYRELEALEIGQGDTHNGGRSVVKLVFKNGNIFYKPRSMEIEKSFIKFQNWLKGKCPTYKADFKYEIWESKNAGFMKQIDNNECESEEELSNFYRKIGQLLCVLYTFNAKDFHSENIIAEGDTPVLIDMETLLHITSNDTSKENIIFDVSKAIEESVIGTALLPTLLPNMNTEEVMEIGGIGRGTKQYSPFKTQVLRNVGTTDISIEFVKKELPPRKNHPIYKGKTVGCTEYLGVIREEFQQIYKWIEDNKDAYISEIKKIFGQTESRAIIKNTNVYTQLVETGFHPDLLHNKWDRNIYLCRIGMFLVQKDEWRYKDVYQYEYNELNRGDIPIFFVIADKDELCTNNGRKFHQINKGKTVIDNLEKKVRGMGKTDCQRQLALINHSFIGCKIETDIPKDTKTVFSENEVTGGDKKNIVTAEKIAHVCSSRSVNKLIDNKNQAMWIGMMGFGNNYYRITPTGLSIYRGNSGMAFFYYELFRKTGNKEYVEMAEKTVAPVLDHLLENNTPENYEGWGAFTGVASEIYLALYTYRNKLASRITADVMENLLENNISSLKNYVEKEGQLDFLSGIAGIIGVYTTAYQLGFKGKNNSIYDFLVYLSEKLIERAKIIAPNKITWFEDNIGYAHGNAGVIAQMARLYNVTKSEKIKDCINSALRYEREEKFDKDTKTWIFRKGAHYYSWCNGIGGLILEKLILISLNWEDGELYTELKKLCEQLKETGFGDDYSICHGDMGSVQLLKQCANVFDDEELFNRCISTEQNFMDKYLFRYWNKLILKEDWGLMTGLSGIGLSLISDQEIINLLSLSL